MGKPEEEGRGKRETGREPKNKHCGQQSEGGVGGKRDTRRAEAKGWMARGRARGGEGVRARGARGEGVGSMGWGRGGEGRGGTPSRGWKGQEYMLS